MHVQCASLLSHTAVIPRLQSPPASPPSPPRRRFSKLKGQLRRRDAARVYLRFSRGGAPQPGLDVPARDPEPLRWKGTARKGGVHVLVDRERGSLSASFIRLCCGAPTPTFAPGMSQSGSKVCRKSYAFFSHFLHISQGYGHEGETTQVIPYREGGFPTYQHVHHARRKATDWHSERGSQGTVSR